MIKLVKVQTTHSDTVLTFTFTKDNGTPDPDILTLEVNKGELLERLQAVKKALGRALTTQDLRLAIVKLIDDVRSGKTGLTETFNWEQYVGVDLEQ